MAGEIKASPRFALMGLFADTLKNAQEGMNKVQIPYFGGAGDVILGGAPKLADDMSFQGLSALVRGGNAATGGIGTYGIKPDALDLAGVVGGAGAVAKPFAKAAAKPLHPVAERIIIEMGADSLLQNPMAKRQIGKIDIVQAEKEKKLKNAVVGFHTSPSEINSISKNGRFGDVLFFSTNKPYSMGKVKKTYGMEFDENNIIDVSDLEDESSVKKISNIFGLSEEEALDALQGKVNMYDIIEDPEIASEASWRIQQIQTEAAKNEGYQAARGVDEQGEVLMAPMYGREKDLIDINGMDYRDFEQSIYDKYR